MTYMAFLEGVKTDPSQCNMKHPGLCSCSKMEWNPESHTAQKAHRSMHSDLFWRGLFSIQALFLVTKCVGV